MFWLIVVLNSSSTVTPATLLNFKQLYCSCILGRKPIHGQQYATATTTTAAAAQQHVASAVAVTWSQHVAGTGHVTGPHVSTPGLAPTHDARSELSSSRPLYRAVGGILIHFEVDFGLL